MVMINKPISGKLVIAAVIVWVVGSMLVFSLGPYQLVKAAAAGPLPEERFAASHDEIEAMVHAIAAGHKQEYLLFQLTDIINAGLTTLALLCLFSFIISRLFPGKKLSRVLAFAPLLLLGLELLENSLLALSVHTSPDSFPGLAVVNWATTLKLSVGICLMLGLILGLLACAVRALRTRRTNQEASSSQ